MNDRPLAPQRQYLREEAAGGVVLMSAPAASTVSRTENPCSAASCSPSAKS